MLLTPSLYHYPLKVNECQSSSKKVTIITLCVNLRVSKCCDIALHGHATGPMNIFIFRRLRRQRIHTWRQSSSHNKQPFWVHRIVTVRYDESSHCKDFVGGSESQKSSWSQEVYLFGESWALIRAPDCKKFAVWSGSQPALMRAPDQKEFVGQLVDQRVKRALDHKKFICLGSPELW